MENFPLHSKSHTESENPKGCENDPRDGVKYIYIFDEKGGWGGVEKEERRRKRRDRVAKVSSTGREDPPSQSGQFPSPARFMAFPKRPRALSAAC